MPGEDNAKFGMLNIKEERQAGKKWFVSKFALASSAFANQNIKVGSVDNAIMMNRKHELHYHRTITEIYIVLAGEVFIQLDNSQRKLEKNDLLCVCPGTPHRITHWSLNAEIILIKDHSDPSDKVVL